MKSIEELRCTGKRCRKAKKKALALIKHTDDVRVLKSLLYNSIGSLYRCRFCSTNK